MTHPLIKYVIIKGEHHSCVCSHSRAVKWKTLQVPAYEQPAHRSEQRFDDMGRDIKRRKDEDSAQKARFMSQGTHKRKRDTWRSQCRVEPKDAVLKSRVRDNITYGWRNATNEQFTDWIWPKGGNKDYKINSNMPTQKKTNNMSQLFRDSTPINNVFAYTKTSKWNVKPMNIIGREGRRQNRNKLKGEEITQNGVFRLPVVGYRCRNGQLLCLEMRTLQIFAVL
jgi:hypothetical protein